MIWCEYVKNYFHVFLHNLLSTHDEELSTHSVETIYLTHREVCELSTIFSFFSSAVNCFFAITFCLLFIKFILI